jgi:hypothetical protein
MAARNSSRVIISGSGLGQVERRAPVERPCLRRVVHQGGLDHREVAQLLLVEVALHAGRVQLDRHRHARGLHLVLAGHAHQPLGVALEAVDAVLDRLPARGDAGLLLLQLLRVGRLADDVQPEVLELLLDLEIQLGEERLDLGRQIAARLLEQLGERAMLPDDEIMQGCLRHQ